MDRVLCALIRRDGGTKRIRTLKQARALILAEWAEKESQHWYIAEEGCHRPATTHEEALLEKAAIPLRWM